MNSWSRVQNFIVICLGQFAENSDIRGYALNRHWYADSSSEEEDLTPLKKLFPGDESDSSSEEEEDLAPQGKNVPIVSSSEIVCSSNKM